MLPMIDSSVKMFMHALLSVASYMMKVANFESYPQHKSPWFNTGWQENMEMELRKCHRDLRKSKDPEDYLIYWRKHRACKHLLQK